MLVITATGCEEEGELPKNAKGGRQCSSTQSLVCMNAAWLLASALIGDGCTTSHISVHHRRTARKMLGYADLDQCEGDELAGGVADPQREMRPPVHDGLIRGRPRLPLKWRPSHNQLECQNTHRLR